MFDINFFCFFCFDDRWGVDEGLCGCGFVLISYVSKGIRKGLDWYGMDIFDFVNGEVSIGRYI